MPRIHSVTSAEDWEEYLDSLDEVKYTRAPKARPHVDRPPATTSPASDPDAYFEPTYIGSRHEREWILTYLGPFYRDHQITDVLRVVKGGKEATVYCCRAHPGTGLDLIAAKVYRPKMFRTFKNDADYKWGRPLLDGEGKVLRDKRILKAAMSGSRAGEIALHASWLSHEYAMLRLLHEHGADVPRPIAQGENAILMAYRGDEYVPAPTLSEVRVGRDEARSLFKAILRNIELMLDHDRIHGDLSAYNVLYWEGEITLIDFPQVIDAYGNPNAYEFLQRDVERICAYFARLGIVSDPLEITWEMWRRVMPDETYEVRGAHW